MSLGGSLNFSVGCSFWCALFRALVGLPGSIVFVGSFLPARGHVHDLVAEFAGIGEVSRAQLPGLVDGARVLGGR